MIKFSSDEIVKICDLYKNGLTTYKLAEMFNVSRWKISNILHKNNIVVNNNKDIYKKYSCQLDYFKEIDSEEKAYWLGFIYADGYVTEKCFGIALSIIDKDHLEKFLRCINSNDKVRIYNDNKGLSKKDGKIARIQIYNKSFREELMKHGVVYHKSNIKKPPKIKNDLIRHFIRGYIDGNGSLYKSKNKFNYNYNYYLSITSTYDMLFYIHQYLRNNNLTHKNFVFKKRKPTDTVGYIRYAGNIQFYNIMNHIYKDAKIYLDRKYNIYQEFINNYKGRVGVA